MKRIIIEGNDKVIDDIAKEQKIRVSRGWVTLTHVPAGLSEPAEAEVPAEPEVPADVKEIPVTDTKEVVPEDTKAPVPPAKKRSKK